MVEHLPPLPWIILFSPLVAAALITLTSLRAPKRAAGLALTGILVSLAATVAMFVFHSQNTLMPAETTYTWIAAGPVRIEFGFLIDQLSLLMLLIVTGVGSCIFLYSTGYMHGDPSYARFFASLSLFAFSMLGIVLANNFIMLFVFWELVAVSSYLLIGFWFEKPSAADAGNKAFIVNRLADFGMVLGIFTVWTLSGAAGERTFGFTALSHIYPDALRSGLIAPGLAAVGALLVFCGVAGKSAQFPLYIWLPDAMEGPTPVSALIHAATMVAAGVYMMARVFFIVEGLPQALEVIAVIGAVTATLAGLLALVQNDIKKILAYSTVSQLGYMVLALGLGGTTPAMYHLTTHAFFKALLFLGAGSMIHALHTQDIWHMGGLARKMPVTAWTFVIGTLALCGLPPLSGFFSKDEILTVAYDHNKALYAVALFNAGLTAFYMTRALWVAVLGKERSHGHGHGHHPAHESPAVMTVPLIVLAVLSVVGGFIGIPAWIQSAHHHGEAHHGIHLNLTVAVSSVLAAAAGLMGGSLLYARHKGSEDPLARALGPVHTLLVNKYYLDDFFAGLGNFFQRTVAGVLSWFDVQVVIRRGVDGVAGLTAGFGGLVRRAQTGRAQTYALMFGAGVIALVYCVVMRS
ncbi:MAG: NADH-quinone oxidoreductase subunit L [Candidatus Omnitrophica bacterium]|nr:NADH-quinone oxidoreductase subunit L [Candidatus Omnitrophota bacterium]